MTAYVPMRSTLGVQFAVSLVFAATIMVPRTAATDTLFPSEAAALRPYELGQAILLFMPPEEEPVTWAIGVNGSVAWLTDGYRDEQSSDGTFAYLREGLLRVHVMGERSQVLKKVMQELAWSVKLSTTGNPKWGPEVISLTPGLPDEICFGSLYLGCQFDPSESMKRAGITATRICEQSISGSTIIGFQLVHPSKEKTLARWRDDGGSGGITSSFELVLVDKKDRLCNDEL